MKIFKKVINENPKYKKLELKEKYLTQEEIIKKIEDFIDNFKNITNDDYCYTSDIIDYLMSDIRIKSCYSDVKKIINEVALKRHTKVIEDANTL